MRIIILFCFILLCQTAFSAEDNREITQQGHDFFRPDSPLIIPVENPVNSGSISTQKPMELPPAVKHPLKIDIIAGIGDRYWLFGGAGVNIPILPVGHLYTDARMGIGFGTNSNWLAMYRWGGQIGAHFMLYLDELGIPLQGFRFTAGLTGFFETSMTVNNNYIGGGARLAAEWNFIFVEFNFYKLIWVQFNRAPAVPDFVPTFSIGIRI